MWLPNFPHPCFHSSWFLLSRVLNFNAESLSTICWRPYKNRRKELENNIIVKNWSSSDHITNIAVRDALEILKGGRH